jgi:hypothetical protein
MSRPDPGPSPNEVLEAVRATGFLLEQEVAQRLDDYGFHSEVSRAYEDLDEGKSREVDVWGFKQMFRTEKRKNLIWRRSHR